MIILLSALMVMVGLLLQTNGTIAASTDRHESSSSARPTEAALIIEATGSWLIEHNDQKISVAAGDTIPEGGVLRCTSQKGTISGRFINGLPFAYPGQDIIGKPLTALVSEPENKPWWALALAALSAPTGIGIAPVVRDFKSRAITKDAILKLSSESLDLTAALAGAKMPFENEMFVVLKKISFDRAVDEQKWGPIKVSFDETNKAATVPLKGIEPGLYELTICDRSAAHKPTPENSWIIASNESDFAEIFNRFERATVNAKEWKQIPRGKINRILRAYLTVLAADIKGSCSQHQN